jgi:hypothetical protein
LKYWAYFLAKLTVAYLVLRQVGAWVYTLFPEPDPFMRYQLPRFPYDFKWTATMLVFFLLCAGVVYAIVWDQRRRCRTCLRRLRMPVQRGHWGMATLLNPVHSESICPYGHGTLAEPDVKSTSTQEVKWREHSDDIWKELESSGKK